MLGRFVEGILMKVSKIYSKFDFMDLWLVDIDIIILNNILL